MHIESQTSDLCVIGWEGSVTVGVVQTSMCCEEGGGKVSWDREGVAVAGGVAGLSVNPRGFPGHAPLVRLRLNSCEHAKQSFFPRRLSVCLSLSLSLSVSLSLFLRTQKIYRNYRRSKESRENDRSCSSAAKGISESSRRPCRLGCIDFSNRGSENRNRYQ